jgi:RNA polymerase sigma factor (sigma-70 family)
LGPATIQTEASAESAGMTALLLEVARTGSRPAFARMFAWYAPRLKTYLRRIGADDATAEELVQETMLTVWRKAAAFDPAKAGASTWVFTIARNLRISALRRERHPEPDGEDAAAEIADPALAADAAMIREQADVRIRLALAALPPEQREVVTLSYYEDQPHIEIAARLKLPLGTVKSRLRLALQRIRAGLGEIEL